MLKLGNDFVNMANVLDVRREQVTHNAFDIEKIGAGVPVAEAIRVDFLNGQTRHHTGPEAWDRFRAWVEEEAEVIDLGPITAKR